ncbi:hypothetical protein PLICRDRAFT_41149 [Plicaturopsis crispa FD-325 SS-3]|nr:hypothetical protein PLICRDRAFT_41149 [Plicaturopsis crispa FD-325 SS-3]
MLNFMYSNLEGLQSSTSRAPSSTSRASPSSASAFGDSTNAVRARTQSTTSFKDRLRLPYPRFSLSRPRKASPTLALSHANANATCITTNIHSEPTTPISSNSSTVATLPMPLPVRPRTRTNDIPFPSSAPIACPPSTAFPTSDDDDAMDVCELPTQHPESPPSSPHPPRRRASSSLPTQHRPASKRARKTRSASASSYRGKRRAADLQFLATVHRSLLWRLRDDGGYRMDSGARMDMDTGHADGAEEGKGEGKGSTLTAQDRILVKRIWHSLVEQGCRPVLLDATPVPSPAPTRPPSPTTPTPTPELPRASTSSAPDAPVMSMPQLVAALILRHHDAAPVRRRPSRPSSPVPRASSPLSP